MQSCTSERNWCHWIIKQSACNSCTKSAKRHVPRYLVTINHTLQRLTNCKCRYNCNSDSSSITAVLVCLLTLHRLQTRSICLLANHKPHAATVFGCFWRRHGSAQQSCYTVIAAWSFRVHIGILSCQHSAAESCSFDIQHTDASCTIRWKLARYCCRVHVCASVRRYAANPACASTALVVPCIHYECQSIRYRRLCSHTHPISLTHCVVTLTREHKTEAAYLLLTSALGQAPLFLIIAKLVLYKSRSRRKFR